MKHAYLIMAHGEWGLLRTLIGCLDDPRNDIYVHIDAKVKDLPSLGTSEAGLTILEDRVDVHWGDLSVVEAEYRLFETAASAEQSYSYYHLLSGVDLPLKSQDYIHRLCADGGRTEYIGFSTYDCASELRRKVQRWHLFPEDFKNSSAVRRILRAGFIRIQELLHIERNRGEQFRKGTQWVSVTDGFVRMLIDAKPWVMKTFSHTFCPDEIYKQTLCWGSGFRQWVYDRNDEGNGCLRAIGWRDGELVDWAPGEYDALKGSQALFARKFNSKDMEFIRRIVELSR